jgi:hypothetical protein
LTGDEFGQHAIRRILLLQDGQCVLRQILGMVPRYT